MYPRFLLLFVCLSCAVTVPATELLGKAAFQRDGNLWVQDLPDGTPRQVTTSGNALYPAWSATGRWLTYVEGRTTRLVDINQPETAQSLPAGLFEPRWSPVADELAFTRQYGGVFLVNAGEAKERQIVPPIPVSQRKPNHNAYNGGITDILWSPDGRQLAYVQISIGTPTKANEFGRIADLYRIDADGTNKRLLLRIPDGSYYPLLEGWTPDGKYILFLKDLEYGASIVADGVPLCAVPANGGTVRQYTTNTPPTGGLAVSPDGRRLVVLQRPGRESWKNARLFVSPLDRVSLRPLTDTSLAPLFPAWSPRGNLLAYTAGPAAGNVEPPDIGPAVAKRTILLADPATGARQGDTRADNNRDEYPLWTADGRHLLFARITPEAQAGLWTMNLEDGTQRQVVERLSPDEADDTGWLGFYGTVGWRAILDFWPGRRLAEPALLIQRRVHVPLRAVVEALGGTVSWKAATRTVTVSLNGKTFTRTLGSDADYSQVYQYDLWMKDRTLFIPLSLLNEMFKLGVQWNAPSLEAVVVNSAASHILIIPTRTVAPLRAPVRGTFPLANAGDESSYLIGGVAGRRYLAAETEAPFLHGGERYGLYALTNRLGFSWGTRPKPDDVGFGLNMTFKPKPGKAAYALAAPWNALPHRPVLDKPSAKVNRQMMREVLDAHGMTDTEPKVDQAVVCDLDGDGRQERLIGASNISKSYFESPAVGDYSFVAIRQNGRTRVINGEFFPQADLLYQPYRYRLAGLLDIDGDGRQEVILHFDWFEGIGEIVYRVEPNAITALYRCYNGL